MSGQPGGWQPISTAPKDGEVVMGGFWTSDDQDAHGEVEIMWDGVGWIAAAHDCPVIEPDGWRPLGGGS